MVNKNGGGADPTPPRKRKMKGVVIAESPPPPATLLFNNNNNTTNNNNLQPQQHYFMSSNIPPPPPPPLLLNNAACTSHVRHILNGGPSSSSQVQRILNSAAPFKPFSFTALLTAPPFNQLEEDDDRYTQQQLDQIIAFHSENLKHSITGILEKHHNMAEEKAAKKLKEKELELHVKMSQSAELESLVEVYRNEADGLQYRIRSLEQTVMSLRTELQGVMAEAMREEEEEDGESSSYEDPSRVGMVRVECKACERQVATVMLWPCRHICVCARCEIGTNVCPVCRVRKTTSVRVFLPLNS